MRPGALSLVVLGLLSSCSILETAQTVAVLVPAPPPIWQVAFPNLAFRITARDGTGSLVDALAPDWREPAVIACAHEVNRPVLAWPFVPSGPHPVAAGVLRPAGGLFPRDLRSWNGEVVLELRWEDGAAAVVLDRAAAAGADLSRFNAERLRGYLRRAGDPWKLDLDLAAQRIAEGAFTAWDLDELPCRAVAAAVGPGSWFLESPFSVPVAAERGVVNLGEVTMGTHRLFSFAGGSWRLQVGEGEMLVLPGS